MAEETRLSYLMNIDDYEIYIEEDQQELYVQSISNDMPIDLSVWIRVVLNDEDGIFNPEEDEDILINATYHGKMSNFECELKKLVVSKQFLKELHFDLDDTYQQQLPFSDNQGGDIKEGYDVCICNPLKIWKN